MSLVPNGWSFVAFNVIPTETTLNLVLGLNDTLLNRILTQGSAAEFISGMGWIGSLSSQGVTPVRLYKVLSQSGGTLTVNGIVPTLVEFTLNVGWTWIGIPLSTSSISIDLFLPGIWEAGDRILSSSQIGSAQYFQNIGWIGTLQTLQAGIGYKVYRATPGTFTHVP